MRSSIALAVVLAVSLGGCSSPRPPTLDYLPPSGNPAAKRSAVVRQPPWLVWSSILDHLEQRGLPAGELDEATGEMVVQYAGDPEPYVDCGWIVAYRKDELDRTPAAIAEASFLRRHGGEVVTVERDLRLDARMSVLVEPDGEAAVVRTESVYALTKTIAPQATDEALHAETISFRSGESGAFSSGTTCQPTGDLERLVLDALPALSLAGS
jgi:hypothetical protein